MRLLLTMNLQYVPVYGGANKSNRYLLEALARSHDVRAVVPALGTPSRLTLEQLRAQLAAQAIEVHSHADADVFVMNGVEVHAVTDQRRMRGYLADQIGAFEPDWVLVSSEDPSQNLFATALEARPERVVYLAHTTSFLPFGPQAFFPSAARAAMLGRATAIVTISDFVAGYIRQWGGLEASVLPFYFYGTGPFANFASFDSGFVTMVNPCAVKGLAIFQELARQLPDLAFAAVPAWGTTPSDRAALARLPNVRLLEPAEDIDTIFAQTRVLLAPSLWDEAFGRIVVEAMLRGIPTLSSALGGLREAGLDAGTLLPVRPIERFEDHLDENLLPVPLVPPQDVAPWRDALTGLLSDRQAYEAQSRRGRAAAGRFVDGLSIAPFEDFLLGLGRVPAARAPVPAPPEAPAAPAGLAELTPEQRALLMLRLQRRSATREQPAEPAIPRAERAGALPLSFAQQRLWFLHQLEPGSPLYNISVPVRLRGPLDVPALERSLRTVVARHEILHTTFPAADGQPRQQIGAPEPIELAAVDLRALPPAEREAAAKRHGQAQAEAPFDLARGPLLRVALLRLDEHEHVLLLTMHHIVSDGWSSGVLVQELAALYAASRAGQPPALPELPIQYADFAIWQREQLAGAALERLLGFWAQQLAGMPALELPTDHPRPPTQSYRGAVRLFTLAPELASALKQLSQQEGVTLFMTLLAAFNALLFRYTGQADIAVGSPIANRQHSQIQGLIGFFVNMLVLRTSAAGDPTFRELLGRVREVALAAYAHQDLPFEMLVERLHPERDLSRNPLFQVAFVLQNATAPVRAVGDLQLELIELDVTTAKFDLTLTLGEIDGGMLAGFEYNTDLFDPATVARMAEHFTTLLEGIVADPGLRLADLPLLTAAERQRALVEWNTSATPAPAPLFLQQFAAQAARAPEATAVLAGGERLSYAELSRRASRLAHYLRGLGAAPGTIVGICAERSLEQVIAVLGVLKAGCAFLPLDPAYPSERLAYMLADARAPLLLTQQHLVAALPGLLADAARQVVRLDADWPQIAAMPDDEPGGPADADQLAYVIYTSGSTGAPKGAMLTQRGLGNLAVALMRAFDVRSGDRVLQFAAFSFDAAVSELAAALAAGATLCLAPAAEMMPGPPLAALLRDLAISTVTLPPSALAAMPPAELPALRTLVVAGEPCPAALLAAWAAPGRRCVNAYGPTETTVCATAGVYDGAAPIPPIGRPIDNARVYLLDARLQPVPVGVPGELYIGGAGVGLGYLNRPDLTAERFVPDPFAEPGARLYRSGDLARYQADGTIVFIGRADGQVKLRGYRIELGEIEAALARHPAVREAVVLAREDAPGDVRLVAYPVPREHPPVSGAPDPELGGALRAFLRQQLPEYMLPSAFVPLAELPTLPNGKVDRRALPAPGAGRAAAAPFEPPGSQLERAIAEIWQAVLKIDRVGLADNFFDLGGHSLLMVQAHARLVAALGREIALVDLFAHPTVGALAAHLGQADAADAELRQLRERVASRAPAERPAPDAVAIVAMSGRFPGAPSVEAFWHNLCDGVESIVFFSDEELLAAGIEPELVHNPSYVKGRAALDGIELFDAAFFGYTPREAELIDPQQRIFLECAWEALERAGYDPQRFPGRVGVFAGVSMNSYVFNLYSNPAAIEAAGSFQAVLSNDKDYLATRVAYKLNLRGASFTVQSACSTSLVATHLACQSLLSGDSDMALAGGVSALVPQTSGHLYSEGGIASPDGHCRAFDAQARGTVSGSGVAIVVLKRLADALADGDQIYAVIKGSAINNDGAGKVGYTAPSVAGQAAVIAEAQARAGVPADTIGYVEAHGTGTPLGDPIEIQALTQAFRLGTARERFCAIGSLKTNIGHLDAAAGAAGLIKAALALRHGQIPPSLHFSQPNPQIDFARSPFYVATSLAPWPGGSHPRRAGVSSFGIGGTNVHMVLEEPPAQAPAQPSTAPQLLVLSAKTAPALEAATAQLAGYLDAHPGASLADVAFTLQAGRQAFAHRRAVVAGSPAEAARLLRAGAPTRLQPADDRPVAFLFPGQGAQYAGMGQGLYAAEPVFRAEVDRCCDLLAPQLGLDLRALLFAPQPDDAAARRLTETWLAQPALFVIEYALARLWMAWGVRPRAMIGHSIGEYVAACLAGVFTLEDALALVAARGRLMQRMPPGAMLAVELPESQVAALLGDDLALAAVNAPALCVVAGPAEAVAALAARLEAGGVGCRRLHTSHAFHSAMMEPILAEFAELVRRTSLHPPALPYISNVSGGWISPGEATDPAYWARHLRQTVRFGAGVAALLTDPEQILLEVGPGQSLSALARQQGARERAIVASMRHPHESQPDDVALSGALGRIWMAGAAIDWRAVHGAARRRVPLPTYPFERQRYWIDLRPGQVLRAGAPRRQADPADWFYVPSWRRVPPPRPFAPADRPGGWLLLSDGLGVGAALARRLEAAGQSVVLVNTGAHFAREAERAYTLDPRAPEDYHALLAELRAAEWQPHTIVHLWSLGDAGPAELDEAALDRGLDRGFYSLLWLAQALDRHMAGAALELVAVSGGLHAVGADERPRAEQAPLLGALKVIPQEYPHLRCRNVDVLPPNSPARLADQLLAELAAGAAEPVVAYRGAHRWAQRFEPIRIDDDAEGRPLLRERGVYLITGGLGGLGLALAEELARAVRARLVLLGRTGLPERAAWDGWLASHAGDDPTSQAIGRVRAIEALGAEVLPLRADVTDPAQLHAAIAAAETHFGAIHGVIHAAGVPGGGMIQLKTRAAAERVLAPKLRGALAIEAAFRERSPDFIVLCSSLAAILGGVGQADYCAANGFLDALAQAAWQRGAPIRSINWDRWRNTGMATIAEALHRRHTGADLADGLTAEQGVAAFRRALAERAAPQVAVSTYDLPALLEQQSAYNASSVLDTLEQAQGARPAHPRPQLGSAYAEPRTDAERAIAAIWESLLGFAPIGIHDDFFELGGHSLLATRVIARVREALETELPVRALFDSPTIAGLAQAIGQAQAQPEPGGTIGRATDEDTEQLLASLDQLSEASVDALLAALLAEEGQHP